LYHLSTLVSSLNSSIHAQVHPLSTPTFTLNSNIHSQLFHSLSTLPFTLSTPTSQEPRQESSPSSPCTLYHNSPRVLPSARKIRRKKVAGKREKRGGRYQNAFIQDVLVFIEIFLLHLHRACPPCALATPHTHIQLLFREERDREKNKRQESEKRAPLCKRPKPIANASHVVEHPQVAEHPSSDAPCAQLFTLLDPCSQHASQKTPKGIHTHHNSRQVKGAPERENAHERRGCGCARDGERLQAAARHPKSAAVP